jgi:hypothetical protein
MEMLENYTPTGRNLALEDSLYHISASEKYAEFIKAVT